ncbi:L,D-transpeptidase family protein [Microbacterium sp. MPKO10]|uniref:L,D-transpeptidase family protein n=1 Tax=Microbacterium sp. MPKO10 TaxID=2989818 RepID=UPI002235ED74|nr:L,D-transpeptidase family protein [Microbacterium sp. MPKO10]MCW4456657.1 L,D-transpeptidase/peptidoglycan binding protein [Microbacterium sp. MPKO10]
MTTSTSKGTTAQSIDDAKKTRRKRRGLRLGLGFGIPGALIVAVAAVSSVVLIAPGVSAAGTTVGWHTADLAAEAVSEQLAASDITITSDDGSVTLTGADLGVSVDAASVASAAHDARPLWNVTTWNSGPVPVTIKVDEDTALSALREAAPEIFTMPENASIAFDSEAIAYTVVDAVAGTGLDFDAFAADLSSVLSSDSHSNSDDIAVTATFNDVEPAITTTSAQHEAETLNTMLASAGFYIGDSKVVGVKPATVASWLTVENVDDAVHVYADQAAIEEVVAGLPEKVNRPAVDEKVVTNSAGTHLRTIQEGQDGWKLDSTDGVAAAYAEQLASGNSVYQLDVTTDESETIELFRKVEVDKSAGQVIMYENDKVVSTFPVAIGKPGTPTDEGHFTVYAQLTIQDMGCVPGYDYCTEDVPWISYFNGDQGFHGTYWHHNFGAGAMMSHGCVNMTIEAAKQMYYFAQVGTEVWVHA